MLRIKVECFLYGIHLQTIMVAIFRVGGFRMRCHHVKTGLVKFSIGMKPLKALVISEKCSTRGGVEERFFSNSKHKT